MQTKYLLTLLTCLFLLQSSIAQNGWTKNKGEGYAQLSLSAFSSKDYFSPNGELFDQGSTFKSRGLLFYGEYGVTPRFTAIVNAPLLVVNNYTTTNPVLGIGDLSIGAKLRLHKSLPIAIQLEAQIPTDDGIKLSSAKEANAIGLIEQINLPTSDGEFNFLLTLAASHSINSGKTFASIFATANIRTKQFSNQAIYGAELGHLFQDKLYIIAKLKVQNRLGDSVGQGSASFLYGEGTTFTAIGVTTMYRIHTEVNMVASFTSFNDLFVKRRNIYGGNTFSLGLAIDFE